MDREGEMKEELPSIRASFASLHKRGNSLQVDDFAYSDRREEKESDRSRRSAAERSSYDLD